MHDRHRIVGTAGHIDHGKSALVRALTGTDPDRLQEERERGITIDLGFAHMELEGDLRIGFIDVPGHERFVKNMLAGIGGIDAVLFVVAADESVMPQSREHLAICALLGIRRGLVAITKSDLVDAEIIDLVELEIRELAAGTFLAEAPMVRCSTVSGAGLAELRAALARLLADPMDRPAGDLVRMPVDRVFTMRGFGTVVTGTLLSGSIAAGDRLQLLPGGAEVAIRGVQVYGRPVEAARAGQRAAVNLQGVDVDSVARGDLLATPAAFAPTPMLDTRVAMLPGHRLEHLQRVRFHHGAAEILARAAVLEGDEIGAADSGLVQLRLEVPYACLPGDRFVIRRYSPMLTIGGGTVIDNLPAKHRRNDPAAIALLAAIEGAPPAERLAALAAHAGAAGTGEPALRWRLGISAPALHALAEELAAAGRVELAQREPTHVVGPEAAAALDRDILAAVAAYHETHPLRAAMPKIEVGAALPPGLPDAVAGAGLQRLVAKGRLRAAGGGVALPDHRIALDDAQQEARDALLDLFEKSGLAPPTVGQAQQTLGGARSAADSVLRLLLREGELVRLRDDLIFHSGQLELLVTRLRERYEAGDRFGVPEFKEWAGISRKHAIPLLEYLDQRRVTRRAGDLRVLLPSD